MKIQVFIEGGFVAAPGLARPIVFDENTLATTEQTLCKQLIREALHEAIPHEPASPSPDIKKYRIEIVDENAHHSLAANDLTMPPAYRKLIDFVREHRKR